MDFVLRFGHNDAVWLDAAEDYQRVLPHIWRWTAQGVTTTIDGKPILLHRYILDVSPDLHVVFLDSNRRNCRRGNLFVVDRGYAALVDRKVYGIRGVTPVIRALEQAADEDDDSPLTTWDQAEDRRARAISMINEIQALLGDRALSQYLSPRERSTWTSDLMRIRAIMEVRIQNAKRWMATNHHLAPTDTSSRKAFHRLKPDQKHIVREERRATRVARTKEKLAQVTPSVLEQVDPTNAEILLRLAYMSLKTVGERINYEYTPLEEFAIKAIQVHFDLQDQNLTIDELFNALGLDTNTALP